MADGESLRLVTYRSAEGPRAGLLIDGQVFDCARVAEGAGLDTVGDDWTTTKVVLQAGSGAHSRLLAAADVTANVGAIEDLPLGPPIPDPDKIICLGLNYSDHAEESGMELPASPVLFAKFRNSLIGPSDTIVLPTRGDLFDYEAELAVVIGRTASNIREADALQHVAGVMAFNDVTARDLQHATSQWTAGKAIDTFAPCGPSLVLLPEIPDIQALRIRTRVNGATVQDGNTRNMIFGVAQAIEFISSLMTLEPGDIIATGTPAGVGVSREPKVLLHDGDVVEVEIDGIGVLSNPVDGTGRRQPR